MTGVTLATYRLVLPADRETLAEYYADELRAALPKLGESYVSELGPVVGAHLGPGALGTVVVRR